MNIVTPKTLQILSHHLCNVLGIDMEADDLVLLIGEDDSQTNGDAIRQWIASQHDVTADSRLDIAIGLRDRLADVLFDFESAIRDIR